MFVVKDDDGQDLRHARRRTSNRARRRSAPALWSGLFGLLLGGPVGMLVAGGIGAGAGAVTAKVVDIGVTDDFVAQLREMVRPGHDDRGRARR